MSANRIGGFDAVAPWYDMLATLVFGQSIKNAQRFFLRDIQKGGKVLILGGGTGWLLADLFRVNPDCEVWYVDASSAMLTRAQSYIADNGNLRIHFIHGTQEQLPLHVTYDAVIANFYFDLFSLSSLEIRVRQIRRLILPGGKLFVADFKKNNSWWQSQLLSFMYLFFRLLCDIEASSLPDWQQLLLDSKFKRTASRLFYGNFISSDVYEIVSKPD